LQFFLYIIRHIGDIVDSAWLSVCPSICFWLLTQKLKASGNIIGVNVNHDRSEIVVIFYPQCQRSGRRLPGGGSCIIWLH